MSEYESASATGNKQRIRKRIINSIYTFMSTNMNSDTVGTRHNAAASSQQPMRVLIVDDEPLAREKIRRFLESDTSIEILGECTDGYEAIELCCNQPPDVLFLDVQMPELNGFEVLHLLQSSRLLTNGLPLVVFVTAFDQYAVQAFADNAIDYVLKPFDRERFHTTLARIKKAFQDVQTAEMNKHLLQLLEQQKPSRYAERFAFKTRGRMYFITADDIEWIEAEGNYANFHVGTSTHLLRETLSSLEERLNPAEFIRVHRSAIVKLSFIHELRISHDGKCDAVLLNDKVIGVGPTYREALYAKFKQ